MFSTIETTLPMKKIKTLGWRGGERGWTGTLWASQHGPTSLKDEYTVTK